MEESDSAGHLRREHISIIWTYRVHVLNVNESSLARELLTRPASAEDLAKFLEKTADVCIVRLLRKVCHIKRGVPGNIDVDLCPVNDLFVFCESCWDTFLCFRIALGQSRPTMILSGSTDYAFELHRRYVLVAQTSHYDIPNVSALYASH